MVYDLMLKRRSIRKFKATPPGKELIEKVVAAAITAPSASNKQPWKFLLVTRRSIIAEAATAVTREVERLIPMIDSPFQNGFTKYAENFTAFAKAPTLIIPTYRVFPLLSHILSPDDDGFANQAEKVERESALISVSCAIQNMLLMAEASGLGACCMTGPLLAEKELRKIFLVHEGWDIASLIAIGFPDESPEMPDRKSLSSTLKWLS